LIPGSTAQEAELDTDMIATKIRMDFFIQAGSISA
jgi:hypothetical protein